MTSAEPGRVLVIRTLGTFEVTDSDGRSIFAAAARANQLLLKLLLSTDGFSVGNERAAQILWPDSPETAGQTNVRKAVFTLRRALERADGADVLSARGGRVSLDVTRCDIDINRLFGTPLSSTATPDEAAAHLRSFDGTFLPGDMNVEWTAKRRAAVTARFLEDTCLGLRIAAATPDAWASMEIETLAERIALGHLEDERLVLELARYHMACGRRVDALATIDRYSASSGDDGATLAAIRASIVENRAIAANSRVSTLGAVARDAERAFALGQFEALGDGRGAAIVLTGPPGIGTTTLAKDVAHILSARLSAHIIDAGDLRSTIDIALALQHFLAQQPGATESIHPSVAGAIVRDVPALARRITPGPESARPGDPRFALAIVRAFAQAAAHAPIALIADVTDADPGALETIAKLIAASAAAPLAVILTARSFGFDAVRREALAHTAAVIELGMLSRDDAHDLLASRGIVPPTEPAMLVAEAGTHPGALVHLLAQPAHVLDAPYALTYLEALERELPADGAAVFRAVAAGDVAAVAAEPRSLSLLRSRGLIDGDDPPAISDRLLERALELRGTRRPVPRQTARARLDASFDRAVSLLAEGRLRTALALLESDDDDSVLGAHWDIAARIAAARARAYALLEESDRAARALGYARERARREGSQTTNEYVELAAAEIALWMGDRETARHAACAAGASAAAAAIVVAIGTRDDAFVSAYESLCVTIADGGDSLDVALAFVAMATATADAREALDAARRAAAVLARLPVTVDSFRCALDLATMYTRHRDRSGAAAATRIVREHAARLDVPMLQTRARALR